jgi:hypothetical protein
VSGLLAELHQDAIGTAEIGSGSGRFLPDRRNAEQPAIITCAIDQCQG